MTSFCSLTRNACVPQLLKVKSLIPIVQLGMRKPQGSLCSRGCQLDPNTRGLWTQPKCEFHPCLVHTNTASVWLTSKVLKNQETSSRCLDQEEEVNLPIQSDRGEAIRTEQGTHHMYQHIQKYFLFITDSSRGMAALHVSATGYQTCTEFQSLA